MWEGRAGRKTRAEAQEDADNHNKLTGHRAAVFGVPK